jgi:hypothetical protein
MNNRKELITRITYLAVAMGKELPEERMKIYIENLADLDSEQLEQGLDPRRYQYFPSIKEIREAVGLKILTIEQEAETEWFRIRNLRTLRKVDLPATTLDVVRKMGGCGSYSGSFGFWPSEEEGFKKREFIGLYVAAKERGLMGQLTHNPPMVEQ